MKFNYTDEKFVINTLIAFFHIKIDGEYKGPTDMLLAAFTHYRMNNTNETFTHSEINDYRSGLNRFENHLKDIIGINNKPTLIKEYFIHLFELANSIKDFPDLSQEPTILEIIKPPEYRIEKIKEDISPGQPPEYCLYDFLSSKSLPEPLRYHYVEKIIPIPSEPAEQVAKYFKLYNELLYGLRNEFLKIVSTYYKLYCEGREQGLSQLPGPNQNILVDTTQPEVKPFDNSNANANLKLIDIFESKSKYQTIMDLLVEGKVCAPITFTWIDKKKGTLGLCVSLIKQLHIKGFYKNNKCPSFPEIKAIAQNTFGLSMGIGTIKNAKPGNFILIEIPLTSSPNFLIA